MNTGQYEDANAVLIQHFTRSYLSPAMAGTAVALEGASIEIRRTANRTNVPAAAITTTQLVEHPELGFALRFRAVWLDDRLLAPTAVHVVIERAWDERSHKTSMPISAAINEWLQAVTP